jgi:hypothetical protein
MRPRLTRSSSIGGACLPSSSARAPKLDVVNDRGWQREFEDPIPLPDGRMLVTLGDAGNYITSLPKKESALPEWQAAIQALMLVSRGGPTMLARIGFMKALHRNEERVFNPDRKDHHWGKRKLKRDR